MDASSLQFLGKPDYSMPAFGSDGVWCSASAVALRDSLRHGSVSGVMSLLNSLDDQSMTDALLQSGFSVHIADGREAVFSGVKEQLALALSSRMDGFGLEAARNAPQEVKQRSFAAKEVATQMKDAPLDFSPEDFDGDFEAAKVVQRVMRSSGVAVDLLGDGAPGSRGSLLLVAGQAMKKGVQGFGFDGLPGKYEVPLEMADLVELHRESARAVAITSARIGLGSWARGEKIDVLDDWVPDSVQRLLHSSLSLDTAKSLVSAIKDGGIAEHAGQIGDHAFSNLLRAQGLDPNAKKVEEQAKEQGFIVQEPNRQRGQYFGPVVAVDHRAALVKYARNNVIILSFIDLPKDQPRPSMKDSVRLAYKDGNVSVAFSGREGREGMGR